MRHRHWAAPWLLLTEAWCSDRRRTLVVLGLSAVQAGLASAGSLALRQLVDGQMWAGPSWRAAWQVASVSGMCCCGSARCSTR